MSINRRQLTCLATFLLGTAAFRTTAAMAADGPEAAVTAAVEAFRKAMLNADRPGFEALCQDHLTYGHSSARVQTKQEFIDEATNGKSTWRSITLTDQSIGLAGTTATARFILSGETESDGKTTPVKIGVLMAWVNEDGKWRLLARQGYKLPGL